MKNTILISVLILLFGCSGNNSSNNMGTSSGTNTQKATDKKQLNITILLDLSDRIDPKISPDVPEHYQKDIENIKYITNLFVNDMAERGTFMSNGKLKVIFSPRPQDPNINIIAEKLNVDLSKMKNKQKKEIYDNLTTVFPDNLLKIYESIIAEKKWIGSDIWRFFKNDVKDYSIQPDYCNILIIFTDGYIYHADSKDRIGNRYAYILPNNIAPFRNNPVWEQNIEKNDFGLIAKRNDLNDLEILVLEISPSQKNKNDEDIIKKILSKWFDEMGVKRYAIHNSDLPEYTKQRINDFIK